MTPHAAAERRARLAAGLPDTVDALLVTRLVNVRYLSGFTGSNGALLIGRDGATVLAIDGRYVIQAAAEAPDVERVESRAVAETLALRAGKSGVRRLAIEAADVTLALRDRLAEAVDDGVALVALPPVVEPLRTRKDADEVAALETACRITDHAFSDVVTWLRPGVTEREVERRLDAAMRGAGADGPAFDSIVAFGPHAAMPHHQPTDRTLAAGDLVTLDFGARYAGYHADMTRTVATAPVAQWQRELHALVAGVQADCRSACTVGAVPRELDARAATAIEAAGQAVAHGLGHGVGLEIHEDPFLTPASTAGPLAAGSVVTVEPGVYLPGRGGVRVEDTVAVEAEAPRSLTTSARELIEVG